MNKEKLIEVLGVQSYSGDDKLMVEYLEKELSSIKGCEFYYSHEDGNIYVQKGEAEYFPCVVSHMDTVHKIVEDLYILQVGHKLTGFNRTRMEQTGIGGDDKVGIFITLECLRLFDNIKAVFFCDEEVGCFGSYDCDMDFFQDVGFVLQCDRQGNKDFVHIAGGTPLSSKPFRKAMNKIMGKFGYSFKEGMMTDVMALKESGLKCSCANMSCGYYNPHSYREWVDMRDVENCLDMVKQMISTYGGILFQHEYVKPKPKYTYTPAKADGKKEKTYSLWGDLTGRRFWDDDEYYGLSKAKNDDLEYCDCCCEVVKKVTYCHEYNTSLCDTCIANYLPEKIA